MAAGVLAQHQLALAQADGARVHDLVGALVLEHAILMDAGLVGEGVGADDGLVGLHHHAGVAADHVAAAVDLLGDDVAIDLVHLMAGVEGHGDLFQAGVAGPLADAVDRHLDLARAVLDAGQRVGRGQTQVVVAVARDDHVLAARRVLTDVADQLAVLLRHGVADGVGDVERGRAGLDGHGQHLVEEAGIAAAGVLGAELDVGAQSAGIAHHLAHPLHHLLRRHLELVLHVDGRSGQEGVDARAVGALDRLPGGVDVVVVGAGQAGDHRRRRGPAKLVDARLTAHGLSDLAHRVQVARRGGREAGLDDVHTQAGQLAGDLQLLLDVQRRARRLLPIAQGGIKDQNNVAVGINGRVHRGNLLRG